MMNRAFSHLPVLRIALLAAPLALAACQLGSVSTSPPPGATQPPQITQAAPGAEGGVSLDISGVAQGMTVESVAAVPPSADRPGWEAAPQHRLVTLQGYPVTDHLMQPQIFIYPTADLEGFNDAFVQIYRDLGALLQSRQPGEVMPYLPLYNAGQVIHSQVQFLDLKNGMGVRYLTQFDQAPLPINNHELLYTFQGLTGDGQYYIAAVLPVTHPGLPATEQVSAQQAAELNDFPGYLAKTAAMLDQQPASSFTPDLAKLDAMIQSLEVK